MKKYPMKYLRGVALGWILSLLLGACSTAGISVRPPEDLPISENTQPAPLAGPTLAPSPPPTLTSTPTPPDPQPEPTPAGCTQARGRIELQQINTSLLPEPLEYRVYLPPCYDQRPEKRYPVLYLIHGQGFNDDQWDRLGADETADAFIAAGRIAPLIMVMPRDREWTQPDEDGFGDALVQVLLPRIDQQYRTLASRQYRAIGGLSRGAGWAVHLGLSDWQDFGAIGTNSLPIFWTDTYSIKTWLSGIPAGSMPRIYLDIGNNDRPEIMTSAKWFENLLTQRNIPHEWHLFAGYHEEKYWQAHVEQYILWYSQGWEELK